ncbi:hypothetical protein P9Z71_08725 [Glaesserella parasuis]|uniref:hypothetical protein n=1 Tax=Glaesserella parasuis TaxID=738 RepID=UPI00243681CC|nr:hypothetical protein [Glaesserella parasuis]MDG6310301.1 hypothetical protein [Glaesserella parasuis]
MALKTKKITIEKGRDAGITFKITEMPIAKADKWATKVLLALMSGGFQVPNANEGMLGIARVALSALREIPEEKALPLLDELMDCVEIVTESGATSAVDLSLGDVQDITTLWLLRKEALSLHIDFLGQGLTPISE